MRAITAKCTENSQKNEVKSSTRKAAKGIFVKIRELSVT